MLCITWRVQVVQQELPTLPIQMRLLLVLVYVRIAQSGFFFCAPFSWRFLFLRFLWFGQCIISVLPYSYSYNSLGFSKLLLSIMINIVPTIENGWIYIVVLYVIYVIIDSLWNACCIGQLLVSPKVVIYAINVLNIGHKYLRVWEMQQLIVHW